MNYKKYYDLYKELLLVGGIANVNDLTQNFNVISNSGKLPGTNYRNQCMWLSILEYINTQLDGDYTLDEIRNIASDNNRLPINSVTEMFILDRHYQALHNLSAIFGLTICIHYTESRDDETYINRRFNEIAQGGQNNVHILSYGAHFELITHIDGRLQLPNHVSSSQITQPKLSDISSGNNFKPNLNLSFGIEKSIINKNEKLLRQTLNNIEKINNNILNIREQINVKKIELNKLNTDKIEIKTTYNTLKNADDIALSMGILESIELRMNEFHYEEKVLNDTLSSLQAILDKLTEDVNKYIG